MSVRRAQREIDAEEFQRWVEFDKINPIGRGRFDLLAGVVTSVLFNAIIKPKEMTCPADFMLEYDKPPPTPAEVQAKARLTARLFAKRR